MSERPPAPAPVRVFVAPTGNGFMRDIASWLVEAASLAGRDARLVDDSLPTADGSLDLVVAPHEFFELFDAPKAALQRAAAVSVCVCTEQPDTPWFHLSVDACRRGVVSLDINPVGTAALRHRGRPQSQDVRGLAGDLVRADERRAVTVAALVVDDDVTRLAQPGEGIAQERQAGQRRRTRTTLQVDDRVRERRAIGRLQHRVADGDLLRARYGPVLRRNYLAAEQRYAHDFAGRDGKRARGRCVAGLRDRLVNGGRLRRAGHGNQRSKHNQE